MRSIYEYENYRCYLKDFFAEQKRRTRVFSLRFFAQKAGLGSHSYCTFLMNGQRNLTSSTLEKVIKGLNLEGKKALYFEKMVHFTQCEDLEKKKTLFRELNSLRRSSTFYRLNKLHYRYFENWFFPVIRHLAVSAAWRGDYGRLGSLVMPRISAEKARMAVTALVEMGLLIAGPEGRYRQSACMVNCDEVPVEINAVARRDVLLRALAATERLGPGERFTTYATLSMSRKTYGEIVDYLDKVKQEIYEKVLGDEEVERVYQMVFQVVPVSEDLRGK